MKSFLKITFLFALVVGVVLYISSCHIKRNTIRIYNEGVSQAPYDVIIVPGIPYDSMNPEIMMNVRLRWAKMLYEKGVTKNIIFSGSAVHTPFIEGRYMKIIADSLGIPTAHTFSEEKALHSTENITYGLEMANSLGFKKVAVATDPFQSIFLSSMYEKINPALAFLPLNVDSIGSFKQLLPQVNVNAALIQNFIPLEKRK
jgi:uncharacterized SAM-binding protein YcdF (DUF218 family)